MPNRLANETSPYLLQHAANPVDWWPWGPEALARAQAEDKPVLLSIGYAACHWCHVMAHESFEDATTAQLMNERFVSIKVDREERPDLDSIYMQAVQAMTGQGGWPMTVFLTPKGEPFYGGTYYPPDDRHGLPSFRRILLSVSEAWRSRRDEVGGAVTSLTAMYRASEKVGERGAERRAEVNAARREGRSEEGGVTALTLDRAYQDVVRRFEPMAGGFGGAPKFPQAMTHDFLLRRWARTGDERALHMVSHSFRRMTRGGIYDQVGGGFHRYAVDALWQVPHFEKMLYDNALLARLGVHLWQATGSAEVRRVTEETLRWVMREMTGAGGGWYSSLDADSEGDEGKFYVWTLAELQALLGADAAPVTEHYGATAQGNFEGRNILHVPGEREDSGVVARARKVLCAARATRVWPGRDEKVLASWNGLMLRAMAEGARVFGDASYRAAALANGEFLWREMVRDNRVFRTHTSGKTRIPGFLEDQAAVALGFLSVYQLTFDRVWFERARALAESCNMLFWDKVQGFYYDTASDHEALVTRPRDITDNATPSGTSLATELLLTVAELTGDAESRRRAGEMLDALVEPMGRYPTMFGNLLGAADMAVHGAVEVAIAGSPAADDFVALTSAVATRYVPSLVLAGGSGAAVEGLALMDGRAPLGGRATAYVCRRYACDAPATDAVTLASQLGRALTGQKGAE